jgi:hypothetical protein
VLLVDGRATLGASIRTRATNVPVDLASERDEFRVGRMLSGAG